MRDRTEPCETPEKNSGYLLQQDKIGLGYKERDRMSGNYVKIYARLLNAFDMSQATEKGFMETPTKG